MALARSIIEAPQSNFAPSDSASKPAVAVSEAVDGARGFIIRTMTVNKGAG